jgi:methyltransferase family protein
VRRRLLALLAVRRRFAWYGKLKRLRMYGTTARSRVGLRYLALDPELDNFTYDIANRAELARTLADLLGVERSVVEGYIAEADADRRVLRPARGRPILRLRHKRVMYPGRRLGWYVTARVLKPSLIVETGIHGGLGSRLLLLALRRNSEEGAPGELISIDIDDGAGSLVERSLRAEWRPIFGSTYDVLKPAIAGRQVGMFIHDSDHTYECERFEFEAALDAAGDPIALISDNAHASTALPDLAKERGMPYGYFAEEPLDHFYPGAGLGIALRA